MNLSIKNICVVLLAAVMGIYLLMPQADAAGQCTGSMCLHCNGMLYSVNESSTDVRVGDHMCDVAIGSSSCNLDQHSNPSIPVVILSAKNPDRHGNSASYAIAGYNLSLFQNLWINDKAPRFHFRSGAIPIYLQNLSLLC